MEIVSKEVAMVALPLFIALIVVTYLYINKSFQYKRYYSEFKDLIDKSKELEAMSNTCSELKEKSNVLEKEFNDKTEKLNLDYQNKRGIYEKLLAEINTVEEDLEVIEFGLYKPHFDFDTSDEYKEKILSNKARQKDLIKNKSAITCKTEWEVGGSKREGKKMTDRNLRLMLRAFNNECDASILKVSWNNAVKMEERIEKAFSQINKLGEPNQIVIGAVPDN